MNDSEVASNGADWGTREPRILVLGAFRVASGGQALPARTRQVGRVGALLAASPKVPVSRDRIIDVLWGASPPKTAINTLQVHISQLRSMLDKTSVATIGDAYMLSVDPLSIDAEWFRAEVLACLDVVETGPAIAVLGRVTRALSLWDGEPFLDVDGAEVAARRNELVELRERALEAQLDLSLRIADSPRALSEVIAAAKGQVTRRPLRESGYEVLIRALIRDGRPAEASDAYRAAVQLFHDQVGVRPSSRLHQAIEPAMTPVR